MSIKDLLDAILKISIRMNGKLKFGFVRLVRLGGLNFDSEVFGFWLKNCNSLCMVEFLKACCEFC